MNWWKRLQDRFKHNANQDQGRLKNQVKKDGVELFLTAVKEQINENRDDFNTGLDLSIEGAAKAIAEKGFRVEIEYSDYPKNGLIDMRITKEKEE